MLSDHSLHLSFNIYNVKIFRVRKAVRKMLDDIFNYCSANFPSNKFLQISLVIGENLHLG